MDNYPPRCGGLAYAALSGRRTSRLSPTQPFGDKFTSVCHGIAPVCHGIAPVCRGIAPVCHGIAPVCRGIA
ncbi:MAG: hypothetical protein LBU34_08500 [Planctomycetaceae bacterium]|nr:hypothetical protein [Planctomycetaceae bacterium]